MPPTTIHTEPKIDDYTSLVDHQSQTPTTFYDARPVLHYTGNRFRAIAPKGQVANLKIFEGSSDVAPVREYDVGTQRPLREEAVAIFITSQSVTRPPCIVLLISGEPKADSSKQKLYYLEPTSKHRNLNSLSLHFPPRHPTSLRPRRFI